MSATQTAICNGDRAGGAGAAAAGPPAGPQGPGGPAAGPRIKYNNFVIIIMIMIMIIIINDTRIIPIIYNQIIITVIIRSCKDGPHGPGGPARAYNIVSNMNNYVVADLAYN